MLILIANISFTSQVNIDFCLSILIIFCVTCYQKYGIFFKQKTVCAVYKLNLIVSEFFLTKTLIKKCAFFK